MESLRPSSVDSCLICCISPQPTSVARERLTEDDSGCTRDQRIALLAKRHADASTVEDDARLAILTGRLRKLSPGVASGDVDNLTAMVDDLEQVSSKLDAIRSKFGLE